MNTNEYFTKSKSLDQAILEMQKDGGQWRKVEFCTKSSTSEVLDALTTLNGLANVSIFKPDTHEKWLTVEKTPYNKSYTLKFNNKPPVSKGDMLRIGDELVIVEKRRDNKVWVNAPNSGKVAE